MDLNPFLTTSKLLLETTMTDSVITNTQKLTKSSQTTAENETSEHIRVERSASPILNENFPKIGPNNVQFPGETEKEAAAGRYFQYNIKPTSTFDQQSENVETTHKAREGKAANMATSAASMTGPFLVNGDLRQLTSGSPFVNPTSSSSATSTAATATLAPHNPRQNPNPDIQDIITGIVKLLNGNVNVHANTQGVRRPSASRINNRGPPRISEVQNLPIDYDGQKPGTATSIRPPPYPFDRPERPFITGVPIPEQIVPVRPGFVSNRPPWHRNKPRPPITTSIGGRRPIPQYKPLPSSQMQPPQEGEPQQQQASNSPNTHGPIGPIDIPSINEEYHDINESPAQTDNSFDSEFSNEDLNTQYIEVSDNDTDTQISNNTEDKVKEELQPPPMPTKKEEHATKKKNNKHKSPDKKKHSSDYYTTIVETSSEVHTVMHMSSTYLPIPMDTTEDSAGIDPSTEEVIFMTASKTPELQTMSTQSSSTKLETSSSSTTIKETSKTSSTISTKPLTLAEYEGTSLSSSKLNTELKNTIVPTKITSVPIPTTTNPNTYTTTTSTTTTTTSTTTTTPTTTTTTETVPISNNNQTPSPTTPTPTPPVPAQYQPRPGIVLDDPEFQPGGRPRPQRPPQPQATRNPPANIQPTRQHLPPGYGEIFDVTLSAIQGPGSKGGSQQTINIKPFGTYGATGGNGAQPGADIIVSASGEEGFVSIDGKRTYINLFGDPTDPPTGVQLPTTPATAIPQLPGGSGTPSTSKPISSTGSGVSSGGSANTPVSPVTQQNTPGSGYGVAETEIVDIHTNKPQHVKPQQQSPPTTNAGPPRPHYRPRTTQPPVRIDTCIVGDDSTCDQAQHERCKTENGVSSCHCRPGLYLKLFLGILI